MNKVVGKKEKIALEYLITKSQPYLMGNVCLWLGNVCVGFFEEEVILGVTITSLNKLVNRIKDIELSANLYNLNDETIFKKIVNIENSGKYFLTLGESFDDYIMRVYKKDDQLHFLWKLSNNPFHKYSVNQKKVQSQVVSICDFTNFVAEIEMQIV